MLQTIAALQLLDWFCAVTLLAVLLARKQRVTALAIGEERLAIFAADRTTVGDVLMSEYVVNEQVSPATMTFPAGVYVDANLVIAANSAGHNSDAN